MLVTGGYFRARLPIEPFDKILGGMCWAITGSNNDIDLEFEDDLKLGQKVKLAEQVVSSLQLMECPMSVFPHQIQGLDYGHILPVMSWLMQKLMQTRDVRGAINRKQGLLNYSLHAAEEVKSNPVDTSRFSQVIFN